MRRSSRHLKIQCFVAVRQSPAAVLVYYLGQRSNMFALCVV